MTGDHIEIRGLRLRCIIGFNPEERIHKQDVVIDMTFFTDLRAGGLSDDPADIFNYKTANKAVIRFVEASEYNTIEALAAGIARVCVVDCAASRVQVSVWKPGALRYTDTVGVTIERGTEDYR
jgi:FolB domain-containing protein